MTKFTPDMIAKAKQAQSPEELLELAKAEQVELTVEEAAEYFEMLNPKMGELADDDLENVSGGGCKTKVNNRKYTVVSSSLTCFTGQWERVVVLGLDGNWSFPLDIDNRTLHDLWYRCSGDGQCGSCKHLRFKGGTGYCSKS